MTWLSKCNMQAPSARLLHKDAHEEKRAQNVGLHHEARKRVRHDLSLSSSAVGTMIYLESRRGAGRWWVGILSEQKKKKKKLGGAQMGSPATYPQLTVSLSGLNRQTVPLFCFEVLNPRVWWRRAYRWCCDGVAHADLRCGVP